MSKMVSPKGGYAPNLDKFLNSLKGRPVDYSVESLMALLKRRQIKGSEDCAIATAQILLQVVSRDKWADADQLVKRIQAVGSKLVEAQPRELVIGNIVKRVLRLIRDEAEEDRNDDAVDDDLRSEPSTPVNPAPAVESSPAKGPPRPPLAKPFGGITRTQSSMFHILADPDHAPLPWVNGTISAVGSGTATPLGAGAETVDKNEIIDAIREVIEEVRTVNEQIQQYADIVLHPGDNILVHKPSRTIQNFLARSKRKFTVLLVVDPTSSTVDPYSTFRKKVAGNGSTVIDVFNTGLMAYMTRITKVVLDARAITAKGDVILDSGAAVIARAAREKNRTVIIVGGVYKLSPDSQANQDAAIEWGDPSKYVNFSDGRMVGRVQVKNAVSELVPADMVGIYISNLGAHSRDHLHGLIHDHYKEVDIGLDLYGKVR